MRPAREACVNRVRDIRSRAQHARDEIPQDDLSDGSVATLSISQFLATYPNATLRPSGMPSFNIRIDCFWPTHLRSHIDNMTVEFGSESETFDLDP